MSIMAGTISRPLTPAPAAPQVLRQGPLPVLRRPSGIGMANSGVVSPQAAPMYAPVRVVPPSGASTPGLPLGGFSGGSVSIGAVPAQTAATCPNCGNVYMPDAIFCRHCGEKRDSAATETHGLRETGPAVYARVLTPGISNGTRLAAEPTCLVAGPAKPLSLSLPPTSSYVPPPSVAYASTTYCTSRASSYAPPVQAQILTPSYSSYQPPVVRRYSTATTPQVPFGPAAVPVAARRASTPVPAGYVAIPAGASVSCCSSVCGGGSVAVAAAPRGGSVSVTLPGRPVTAMMSALPTAQPPPVVPGFVQAPTPLPPVPPPGFLGQEVLPNPVEPQEPPSLTAGIPDPASIDRQKANYSKGLDDQLKHGTDVLAQQLQQQSDYLFKMGDQRKRQYALQVDQEIKQREMELAQQHNEQLLLLQQAAQQQKSALEHQANALLLEFHQKKSQEDLIFQQYQFQKRQYETQLQYNEEMKELQAQQRAAASQVATQKVAIAQQAVTATQQAMATAQQQAQMMSRSSVAGSALLPATSYGPAPPATSYGQYLPGTPPQTMGVAAYAAPATAPSHYTTAAAAAAANLSAYWNAGGS
eukprot:TRINITY_DN5492_c0_g1_i4.p1 TRINITY_DN5492_c0_g1~~TRINITY_DN5492_c0_g1_i4.p1  ORF type:complete len:586 (-),score=115.05 TRINITY_DN5492_c0_g1_i4:114-1871(-)